MFRSERFFTVTDADVEGWVIMRADTLTSLHLNQNGAGMKTRRGNEGVKDPPSKHCRNNGAKHLFLGWGGGDKEIKVSGFQETPRR